MAWRDDKARATLIREAAGSMKAGKTPQAFAELLFDHINIEDLVNYDATSLAFLAEQAWEHHNTPLLDASYCCRFSECTRDVIAVPEVPTALVTPQV